ncbi:alkaline phosphatase D family protein [Sandaracinus amylolyticus]|uniref:Phosphodiesterase/alkaline phosphatase D n=1 Tax=Sandaracinus amylolyticus TaxID=927083 RepID=A0A0F6W9G6_9BACT|nr:alkaline phosphatase D family protein [Sandaracinus amylolyticus]AKF10798.1 Phosphodiesterase/alkaline phosphatase D [Sandaracinus amylolyticus]
MGMPPIGRRRFLKTVVVSAGAVTLAGSLSGCGDDGGGDGDPSGTFPQSVASGDPRTDSIVLWTRLDRAGETVDTTVTLELALDEAFSMRVELSSPEIPVEAAHDHCVRVKVDGLEAGTRYYYRFVYESVRSRVGRFKTAPARDADVPVRFAIVSCQDYVGRFYNSYLPLLDAENDELDFVVHLGDYIYETTGDPSFMSASDERAVEFTDTEGAIALEEDGETFYAARSLSNYRELYKTYRSDPILQRVHERFPFIVTWDDHEFADDSWQDVATRSGGREDERDPDHRRNAEQVFLEFHPIARDIAGEDAAGSLVGSATESLFPENRIYRDLRFGRHLHLVVGDYRSYRPDHPIAESAWPGTVVMTEAQVRAVLTTRETEGRLPEGQTADVAFEMGGYRPYVDLADAAYADYKTALQTALTGAYTAGGAPAERAATLATEATAGAADAAVVNATLTAAGVALPPIEITDELPRGLSYASLGKSGLFGSIGARYLVVARHYDLWAEHRAPSAPHPLGEAQLGFMREAIDANDDATWTVLGSSVSFSPLILDVTPFAAQLPEGFPAEQFYLNVDHWDGFPLEKEALLRDVLRPRNALVISGDIHSAFVTDHDGEGGRAIELTTPGISSGNFRELLYGSAQQLPSLAGSPVVESVLTLLDSLMMTARPQLKHSRTDVNGLIVAQLDATGLEATLMQLPPEVVRESFYERAEELAPRWQIVRYRVARTAEGNGPIEMVS